MNQAFNFNATKELLHESKFYYIICAGTDGNYSYVNKRYADSFKFMHVDLVGKPYYITMHADDRQICEEAARKCYEHPGKLFPAIIRKHDGNGGYVITQWEFTLMLENDIPTGVFCLGYDITEVIRAKSLVTAMNVDLEVKNKALDTIAFEQSHIVRAPLANIIGLVSVLKDLDLGPNASLVISMLEESSRQLDHVVRAIVHKTYP